MLMIILVLKQHLLKIFKLEELYTAFYKTSSILQLNMMLL